MPDEHGLLCARCGKAVDTSYVAKSYKQPGGVARIRYCQCGQEVCTFEQVIPVNHSKEYLVIAGLDRKADAVGTIRKVAEALGGFILNRKKYG